MQAALRLFEADASRCLPLSKGVWLRLPYPVVPALPAGTRLLMSVACCSQECCRLAATRPRCSNTCGRERTGAVLPSESAWAAQAACCWRWLNCFAACKHTMCRWLLAGRCCLMRGTDSGAASGARAAPPLVNGPQALRWILCCCDGIGFTRNPSVETRPCAGAASALPRHGTLMGRKAGPPAGSPSSIAHCCAF